MVKNVSLAKRRFLNRLLKVCGPVECVIEYCCLPLKVIPPNVPDFDVSPLAPPSASPAPLNGSRKIFQSLKI